MPLEERSKVSQEVGELLRSRIMVSLVLLYKNLNKELLVKVLSKGVTYLLENTLEIRYRIKLRSQNCVYYN